MVRVRCTFERGEQTDEGFMKKLSEVMRNAGIREEDFESQLESWIREAGLGRATPTPIANPTPAYSPRIGFMPFASACEMQDKPIRRCKEYRWDGLLCKHWTIKLRDREHARIMRDLESVDSRELKIMIFKRPMKGAGMSDRDVELQMKSHTE